VDDSDTIPIVGPATATIDHARAWARQSRGVRLTEVDAYLYETWRLAVKLGYDPAVVAAQASEATSGWTSDSWRLRLNPAALGVRELEDRELCYDSGISAARAHVVHLSAYVKGYDARVMPFLRLDPTWQSVFERGHAGGAKALAELAPRWSDDLGYGRRVHAHLDGLRRAIQSPEAPAQPEGGACPPERMASVATGNWSERTFDQIPVAIVFSAVESSAVEPVLAWYANPASRESVHAIVDRDGIVFQVVDPRNAAWAIDNVRNPRRDVPWLTRVLPECRQQGGPMTVDDFVLTLAYVGTPGEPPTEGHYHGLLAMAGYWRDRFAIPINRAHLLRMSDLNSVDMKHNPGRGFDLDRIILTLGGDPKGLT
jgi:hypothetical protein